MRFELEPDNRGVPDKDVLGDLKRVCRQLGHNRLTQRSYRGRGRSSPGLIERRFGSWNNALEQAGIPISKRHGIKDEVLFANLEAIWRRLGRQPRRDDLDTVPTAVSKSAYEYRFGGWRKALEAFVKRVNSEGDSTTNGGAVIPLGRRTSRQLNLRLRFRVMKRDGFRCCNCGKSPATTSGCELHIDHKVAWSEGGETVLANLQTLCRDCNLGKSNS